MNKKTNNTQLNPMILLIVSICLLLIGSIVTGYLLSKDQTFSPLPSVGGIIAGLIIAATLSGFVSYAYAQYHSKALNSKIYSTFSVAIGAVIISILLQHLARIMS